MPNTSSLAPFDPKSSMIVSKRGTRDSPPSRPNLFAPGYLDAKNFSSPSESTNLFKICCFFATKNNYV